MAILVVVSGMPPQINVYNPQNNQSVSGTVEIVAEVESRHPLCYVKVSFDKGVSWSLMEQEDGDNYFGKYTFNWNTKSLTDGDQKILVKTLDTFGRSDSCSVDVKIKNSKNTYLLYSGLLDVSSSILQGKEDTQDAQSSAINTVDENEETPIELEWAEPLNNSFHYNTLWVDIDCIDPDSVMDTIWYRVINETSGAQGSIVIDNTILASPTYAIELNISSWEDGSLYRIEAFGNTTSGVTCALSDEEATFFSIDILRASFNHNPATQRVPNVPIPEEDIQINATISNNLDIDTVILVYSINGDWTTHNDTTVMTSYYGDSIYSGTIPGQDAKVYIEYYFYYNTTLGAQAVNDNLGIYYSFIVDPVNIDYISPPENNSWVSGLQIFDWDLSSTPGDLDYYIIYRNATIIDEGNLSGGQSDSVSISDDTTLLLDGFCYNYTLWVNNTTPVSNSSSIFIYVDNQNPNIVFEQSTAYMNSTVIDYGVISTLNISVQVTDGISGVDTIYISHNATGSWQNFTMPANGTTNFYFNITDVSSLGLGNVFMWLFYANDTAGVWQIQDNLGLNYSIVVADLSGPNLVHLNDSSYLNDTNPRTSDSFVQFNATVTDNVDVESVFLCTNATGSFVNYTALQDGATTTWYVDLDVSIVSARKIIQYYWFANDTNAVNPTRFDNDGNYWWFGYFIDDEPPLLNHANDSLYLNDTTPQTSDTVVRFNATVTDNEGVESVFLCSNVTGSFANYSAIQDGATTTWYVDLDVSSVRAGEIIQYYWYVNDTNAANPTRFDNLGVYWWFGYFVDDEPPIITHNQVADVNDSILTTSDTSVRLNATVTDNENVVSVFLCENSTITYINRTMLQDGDVWYYDLDISGLSAGTIINYYFFANDSVPNQTREDNAGSEWQFNAMIDDEPPVLTHANDSLYLNDTTPQTSDTEMRFNATVTDNEGVESVFLCSNVTGSFANYSAIQDGATTTWYVDLDVSSVRAGEIIQYYWYVNDTNAANPTRFDNLGVYWWFGYFVDDEPPIITHNQVADVNDSILTTSDTSVRLNATVTDNENVVSVFLCENSTITYINRTMLQDGDVWYYDLDISGLSAGTIINYYFFANDSVPNQTREDNGGFEWQFNAIIDDEPPQLVHANDSNYLNDTTPQTSDTVVRINATVTDNEGVESVFLCANVTGTFANYTALQDGDTWYYDLAVASVRAGEIIQYYWYANDTNAANPTRFDNGGLYWWFGYFVDDEPPQLVHENTSEYLNDTTPETSDVVVQFNATATDNEAVESVFLCANVTGTFANYTALQDGDTWYYDLAVASVRAGEIIQYYWYANDTNAANPTRFDNGGLYWWFGYFVDDEPPQLVHANDSNYLNDTTPQTSDIAVRFNATVTDNEGVESVFLCANVTGSFANYTAIQDDDTWYYNLPVASVRAGEIIQYYWYANDTNVVNPTRFDNGGLYWWFGYFVDDEPPIIIHNQGTDVNDSILTTSDTTVRINATVTDNENVFSVFLCENSTNIYRNQTMIQDRDVWYYDLDISGLAAGTIIYYYFFANDSVPNQAREDNGGNEWQLNAIIDDEPPQLVHANDSNYLNDTTPQTRDNVVRFNATVTDNEGIESVFLCANVTGSFANYTALQDGITTTWYVDLDVSTVHMGESIRYYWYANDTNAANPSMFNNAGLYWWFGPFIDDEPPNLSYIGPQNGSWVTAAVNLYWTVVDEEVGVDRWELWRNGTLENSASGPIISFLYVWDELEEGKWYNFTLWAVDNLGFESTLYIRLGVDSLSPIITLESPANNSFVEHFDIIDVDFQDNFSGVNLTWYNWNGGINTTFFAPWQITIPDTLLEGPNYLYVFANDTNSNLNSTVYVFVVDNLYPAVTEPWTQFTNNTSTNANSLTVDIDFSDAYIDYAWFRVVNTTDLSIVQGDTNYTNPLNRLIDISGYSDGIYRVDFWVNDTSGHTTYSYQFFEVDKTLPIITLNSPANNSLIEPGTIINLEIYDPNHPGDTISVYNWNSIPPNITLTIPHDIDTTGLSEGIHDLYIYANDSAGNWAILHLQYDFDLNAPQVVLDSPNNDTTISGGTWINLTISDSAQNLEIVLYNWDGTPNNTLSDPWDIQTTLSEGWHDLTIYANDSLGHTNTTYLRFYTTYLPVINYIAPPANGSWVNNIQTLTWDCSDDTALSYYRIFVNGTEEDAGILTGNSDTVNYDLDTTTPWLDGDILNITLWVNDTSNQFSISTVFLRVDNTDPELPGGFQPQLSVANPDDNDNVTITIPDPLDISLSAVYLNYTLNGGSPTSLLMEYIPGSSYRETIPAQSAGTVVVYFFHIFDSAGNDLIVTSSTYTYTVAESGGGNGGGGDGGGDGASDGDGDGGGDGDTTPLHRLYIIETLISSTYRQGQIAIISVNVTDETEKGVEEALVMLNIGNRTWITLEDLGEGLYEGEINTINIDPATYLCILTAKKKDYASATKNFVVTIQPALPDNELLIGMGGMVAVIGLACVVYVRKKRRYKSAVKAREVRDYYAAVEEFLKVGKIEEAAETCLIAEEMYIDLAKLVEEKIGLDKAIELWLGLGEKYRKLRSYVLAERAYRLAEAYEIAGKMYFDYAVDFVMTKKFKDALNNVRKAVTLFTKAKDREKQSVAERYLTAISSLLTAEEVMEAGKYADAVMIFSTLTKEYKDILPIEYLRSREAEAKMFERQTLCVKCGFAIPEEAQECPNCGQRRARCIICGLDIQYGEEYIRCPYCKVYGHKDLYLGYVRANDRCPNCKIELNENNVIKDQLDYQILDYIGEEDKRRVKFSDIASEFEISIEEAENIIQILVDKNYINGIFSKEKGEFVVVKIRTYSFEE